MTLRVRKAIALSVLRRSKSVSLAAIAAAVTVVLLFSPWANAIEYVHDGTFTVDGTTNDNRIGESLAATESFMAVGAPLDAAAASQAGAVHIFERDGDDWSFRQTVRASDAAVGDQFGYAVALEGTTLVVGAPYDDGVGTSDTGSVYTFDLDGGSWLQTQKIVSNTQMNYQRLGFSVSISGDKLAAGMPGYNGASANVATYGKGAVSMWQRDGLNWSSEQFQEYAYTHATAGYGYALSMSGETLAVGAPRDTAIIMLNYDETTSMWSSGARIVPVTGGGRTMFGQSVSLRGNTLVTANYDLNDTSPSIYVYTSNGSGEWSSGTLIVPADPATLSLRLRYIGQSVAIAPDESSIIVGSMTGRGSTSNIGSAFVLQPNSEGVWQQTQALNHPTQPGSALRYGYAVAYSGTQPLVTAPFTTASNARGAVYSYVGGDATPPVATIRTDSKTVTNQASFVMSIDISEVTTNFAVEDISVPSSVTLSDFEQVGAMEYRVRVTMAREGDYTLMIPAGRFTDAAGNGNTASNSLRITYDTTLPSSYIIAPDNNYAFSSGAAAASVRVSDPGGGLGLLTEDHIHLTNATIEDFSAYYSGGTSTHSYATFRIVPTSEGPIEVGVKAGSLTDEAGNANSASEIRTIQYDTTPPSAIFSAARNPTNISPIPVVLSFSEAIGSSDGVSLSEIAVTGGSVRSLSKTSPSEYSLEVVPDEEGEIRLDYAAGQAKDLAGNSNTAAPSYFLLYDLFGPDVTISSSANDPTNQSPLEFIVATTEPVTGIEASDFVVSGGVVASVVERSSDDYLVSVTPNSDEGEISLSLPQQRVTDAAGNWNQASNVARIYYDGKKPIVQIAHNHGSHSNAAQLEFRATFSEAITILPTARVDVVNGTVVSLGAVDGEEYMIRVTPAEGEVVVTVAAGSVRDAAGNTNEATTVSLVSDRTAPSATVDTLTSGARRPALSGTMTELASKIDVIVDGATYAANIHNDTLTWTVPVNRVSPLDDGVYDVEVVVTDLAGNIGRDTTHDELTIDASRPEIAISAVAERTNQAPVRFRIVSDRIITGLLASDFVITGGVVGSVMQDSDYEYLLTVEPDAEGEITAQLPAESVMDQLGNTNAASNTARSIYDTTGPTIVLSGATTPVNGAYEVYLQPSEQLNELLAGNITVTNGQVLSVVQNGNRYTVEVQPASEGEVALWVAAGEVYDQAGNANSISNVHRRTYDNTPPGRPTVEQLTTTSRTPELTGTYDRAETAELVVVVGQASFSSASQNSPLVLQNGNWKLDIARTNKELAFGVYDIRVIAYDIARNAANDSTADELRVNSTGTITGTVDRKITPETRPELTGTVSHTEATITVKIDDDTYSAINNQDGSWVLPANTIKPLEQGTYDVELTLLTADMNGSDTTVDELTIDRAAPKATFTRIRSAQSSPRLFGTLDTDNTAVEIEIAGKRYAAMSQGGTWEIPAGVIQPPLQPGVYMVTMYIERHAINGLEVVRHAVTITADEDSADDTEHGGGPVGQDGSSSASPSHTNDTAEEPTEILRPLQPESDSTDVPGSPHELGDQGGGGIWSSVFVIPLLVIVITILLLAWYFFLAKKRRRRDTDRG